MTSATDSFGPCRFPVGTGKTRAMCGLPPVGWCSTCSEGVCEQHRIPHGMGFNRFQEPSK